MEKAASDFDYTKAGIATHLGRLRHLHMISNYLLLWWLVTTEVIRLTVTFFNEVSDLISSIRAEASLRVLELQNSPKL